MEIEIIKLDHQGRGIGKLNEKIIFIPFALPGEIVKVELTKVKKKYCEGKITSFLKTSPERIVPICPYFCDCGGCDLMHMDSSQQLLFKEQKIREIMTKFTEVEEQKIKQIVACENPLYYRNKVTFHVQNGKLGFYAKQSNQIIEIEKCYISTPKINKILEKLKSLPLFNVNQIVVRTDDIIDEIMILFYLKKEEDVHLFVDKLKDDVTTIATICDGKEKIIYGNDTMIFELNQYQFQLSPTSFFQVNRMQCEKLYELVKQVTKGTSEDVLLDLYCGTGTIGIYLAKTVKEVYGVEINSDAIKNANRNKELNSISNIAFECGDAKEVVKKLPIKPTIVVVDPPRQGLDLETIERLITWNVEKIIYVSCDPVTLARDINLLSKRYEINEIIPVDMFPNTNHVECVCVLKVR